MAYATKGYSEYSKYLMENRNARDFLRRVMEADVSSLEWNYINSVLDVMIDNRENKDKMKTKVK